MTNITCATKNLHDNNVSVSDKWEKSSLIIAKEAGFVFVTCLSVQHTWKDGSEADE